MKARFIHVIGTRAVLRVYWGDNCPNCGGTGRQGCHDAEIFLQDSPDIHDNIIGGEPEDYTDDRWPKKCDSCNASVSSDANRQVFRSRLYNTSSGKPEPGDLYFEDWYPKGWMWDNDTEGHLLAVLPNGNPWDIDSRASNCTMPNDRNHRCWCRHGEPPNITVDKNGVTCQAGAGSIASGSYHGFLINGEFT